MSIASESPSAGQAAKPLLAVFDGEPVARPPVWLMRQAGRYLPEYRKVREHAGGFLDLCYSPELAADVTLQPVRRFELDAAILFSDILVVPDAMGMDVRFQAGEGPVLSALADERDLTRLEPDRVRERLAPVYDAAARVAAALPAEVALIGFAGAPWTVASYMLEGGSSKDFAVAKRWMWGRPEAFGRLIDMLVEATVEHLDAQIEAGAEAVQIFDSWAGALPERAFEDWSVGPIARIVSELRARRPAVPAIAFPRGAGVAYADFAERTGADAVSLDTAVPLGWAAGTISERTVLQGNLDPVALLVGGSALEREVAAIREAMAGRRHIFNLGHGVLPPTPPEHVARLVELVRQ